MFLYDEDSRCCYFNPNSWETSDQYFLIGVVFGLAIYNSTILDVALPHFAFRKLLSSGPTPAASQQPGTSPSSSSSLSHAHPRPAMTYSLDDLAEYRPRLAKGLRDLLDYDGDDVESLFSLTFAVDVDRYGATSNVPLCPGGDRKPVTNANRREYVDLYVRYLLDGAVARQFEPFKRGFFTVADGAALSLFRPEEIELLLRGADDDGSKLDVASLRAVAEYENWNPPPPPPPPTPTPPHHQQKVRKGDASAAGPSSRGRGDSNSSNASNSSNDGGGGGGRGRASSENVRSGSGDPGATEPTVEWFWAAFAAAAPRDQRKLLAFVTGSDRVPAMGAATLRIRLACVGDDTGRFPIARTCFNTLSLARYRSREELENRLWRAVHESEGFGLR